MCRSLRRHVAVWHALAWLPLSSAVLKKIEYKATNNMLANVAQSLLIDDFKVQKPCTVTPDFEPGFTPHLFVIQCLSTVENVQVIMHGDNLYDDRGKPVQKDSMIVPLPKARVPTILWAHECKNSIHGDPDKLSSCSKFKISVFRNGAHMAELAAIGITSTRLIMLEPNFDPFTTKYKTKLQIGEPFAISASAKQSMAKVGIEFSGDSSVDSGLPASMKCEHGTHSNHMWKLPGFKATGTFEYTVCAIAADRESVRRYTVEVEVTPLYSSKLKAVDVGKWKMEPAFDPKTQSYVVEIPASQMSIPLSVESKDEEAEIYITYESKGTKGYKDNKAYEKAHRGKASRTIYMHDNDAREEGQPPQWTVPVSVFIKSADGSHRMAYVITVKQTVSKYCYLKDITIGKNTNCKLTPEFDPKVMDYSCTWWWENEKGQETKWGEIAPVMNHQKCPDCKLLMPDNKVHPRRYLSMDWMADKLRIEWYDKQVWRRKFLYGDYHDIPIQVVSADKFTSSTYVVRMLRDAPWWMRTWLTRLVSRSASILSVVMAISSATNIMALAKQVQFMTLTTEIDGVPPVYADFADSLKNFNFDAFGWIDLSKFGLPTEEDIKKYKRNMLKYLEHQIGIDHATLLLQYCEAKKEKAQHGDYLYPNAFLVRVPENAENLINQLKKKKLEDAERKAKLQAEGKEEEAESKAKATERRLFAYAVDTVGTWLDWWKELPSWDYLTSDLRSSDLRSSDLNDDRSINDVQVSLRGSSGFSVSSSKSFVLNSWLAGNYSTVFSSNSSMGFLDKVVMDDALADLSYSGMPTEEDDELLQELRRRRKARRLQEDALEEMDDEDEDGKEKKKKIHWSKKIDFSDKEYEELLKLVMKRKGMTHEKIRASFPEMKNNAQACEGKQVLLVEKTVKFYHELLEIRDMMESTTGVFIILCLLLIFFGTIYYAFYTAFMKGNQRRPRVLEPGPLVIFVCDYCLISFAKSAAKILFRPTPVSFFVWKPSLFAVRTFCGAGLVLYPVLFVLFILWRVLRLLNRRRLAWNKTFGAYSDPRCQSIKVTLPPKRIPSFIPVIYQVMVNHIRACVPVLDEEGDKLDFDSQRRPGDTKKEEAAQRGSGNADEFERKIDEEIAKELQNIRESEGKTGETSALKHKAKVLDAQREAMHAEKTRKEEHAKFLKRQLSSQQNNANEVMRNVKLSKSAGTLGKLEKWAPPWFKLCGKDGEEPGEDDLYHNKPLHEIVKGFRSKKRRNEVEKLEQEEKLAMTQWIQQSIRTERNLLKYNILKVEAEQGYLKPKEPIVKKVVVDGQDTESQQIEWEWLDSTDDYDGNNNVQDKRGHHPKLDEFMVGEKVHWFEDQLGQRLVYPGNDNWWCLGWAIPGGSKGGTLKWMEEPSEGWEEWEKAEELKGEKGAMYADKWQYLYFNEDQQWNADDAAEQKVNICCIEKQKNDVMFYPEVRGRLLKWFSDRVPYKVDELEKVEMRKWLWGQLLEIMQLKLKVGHMADQHPKYYKHRTLEDIAKLDFHDLWVSIEQAVPTRLTDHEQNQTQKLKLHGQEKWRGELMDYTLMRVEDTYSYNFVEPWMKEIDPPGDNEYKVMFDTDSFWKTSMDHELTVIRQENDLVPKTGYYSSEEFLKYPDREFGCKRYNLYKPDTSVSKVRVDVLMRHVLPLMRYTNGFRVNVPNDSLDMPYRDEFTIVIGSAVYGGALNYVVERMTTLSSIILLAGDPGGQVTASIFFLAKALGWLYNWYVAFESNKYEEKEAKSQYTEEQREKQEDENEDEKSARLEEEQARKEAIATGTEFVNQNGGKTGADEATKLKPFPEVGWVQHLLVAFCAPEVTRLGMQALTLLFLTWGQFGMPPPLCAIICIIVCCLTMILMNIRTFSKEIQKALESVKEFYNTGMTQYRTATNWLRNWLEGDNPFRYQFMVFEARKAESRKAENINFVVSELGITFEGTAEIPVGLPPEEAREQEVSKKMVHYAMDKGDSDDTRYKNVRDHARYEGDISSGLFVALDIDQMMFRKTLPEIMATVQCVNHADSNLSRPEYDSYLSLTKELPDGEQWELEYEQDRDKVNTLLEGWKTKFEKWLDNVLGAVESEKTATVKIKEHLNHLLANECTGNLVRNMFYLKVESIIVPAQGDFLGELDGLLGYVTIVYDSESVVQTTPIDRMSKFGQFKKDPNANGSGPRMMLDLSSDVRKVPIDPKTGLAIGVKSGFNVSEKDREYSFSFSVPIGVNTIKFAIWVQLKEDKDGLVNEQLVALSEEQLMAHLVHDEFYGDKLEEIPVYTKWSMRGSRIEPPKLDDDENKKADDDTSTSEKVKDCLWKFVTCDSCRHKVKEEELEKVRGKLIIRAREFNEKELAEDTEKVKTLEDVTKGESSLNLAKLGRHKDRWLSMAEFFGIPAREEALKHLDDHLVQMEAIGTSLGVIDGKLTRALEKVTDDLEKWKNGIASNLRDQWLKLTGANESNKTQAKNQKGTVRKHNDKALDELEKQNKVFQDREEAERDSARKEKREILMRSGYRRQLEDPEEMKKSMKRLREQIDFIRKCHKEDEAKGIRPVHISKVYRRLIGKAVVQTLLSQDGLNNLKKEEALKKEATSADPKKIDDPMIFWFSNRLLDAVSDYRANRITSSKQILHYIIMSDQLKPSKSWRPDAISPHVCSIVSREYEDVPEVKLTSTDRPGVGEVVFKRESRKEERNLVASAMAAAQGEPMIVNGKLAYKAEKKGYIDEVEGGIRFDAGKKDAAAYKDIFLYWDGRQRWVISCKRGEPAPYGVKHGDVIGFMWAADTAVTPDKITKSWFVWSVPKEKWQQADSLKILGPNLAGKEHQAKKQLIGALQALPSGFVDPDSGHSWFDVRGLFSELFSLFSRSGSRKVDPELKDCLVSLNAESIEFAWKDDHVERLAPFRRFLLQEFGTYEEAWLYMSRANTFPKSVGAASLNRLMKVSYDAFKQALAEGDTGDDDARAKRSQSKMFRSGTSKSLAETDATATDTAPFALGTGGEVAEKKSQSSASLSRQGSRVNQSRAQITAAGGSRKRTLTRQKSYHSHVSRSKTKKVTSASLGGLTASSGGSPLTEGWEDDEEGVEMGELQTLFDWLHKHRDEKEDGGGWDSLSAKIMDALDKDKGGEVSVSELHDIYEEGPDAPKDGILLDFRNWCLMHPWYKDFAKMWAELSENVEVTKEAFQKSMRHVLLKFLSTKKLKGKQLLGISYLDDDNAVTVITAQWRNTIDPDAGPGTPGRQARYLQMHCKVHGDKKCVGLCSKKQSWAVRAEGFAKFFEPSDLPQIAEENKGGGTFVAYLNYKGVPEDTKLYFRFGTATDGYTEISFFASNPGAPEEKAEMLFSDLDIQMSGGISLRELIPVSGPTQADVDQALLKFSVPLSQIQEIKTEAHKTYGAEKAQAIQIKVNSQFATSPEWSTLKLALDPDWKCLRPDQEVVHFAMRPQYYGLWKQVISECDMEKPQEWVRFYDGGYMEHPIVKGVYMRNAYGIQKWSNGTVYVGRWENHVYHGAGTLYEKVDDWQAVAKGSAAAEAPPTPIYSGNWDDGVRSGRGSLNWEQETVASTEKNPFNMTKHVGIRKCYHGNFRDGLFHGKGLLVMRDAVSQTVPHLQQNGNQNLRKVIWPIIAPTVMLRFEGEFDSNWDATDEELRRLDPQFDKIYNEEDKGKGRLDEGYDPPRNQAKMQLHHLSKRDQHDKTARYLRYFGVDKTGIQKAGAPMPDVGLVYYRLKLNNKDWVRPHQEKGLPAECKHILKGKATYSDGSEYDGEFLNGWPHGEGMLTQYDFDTGEKMWIASYRGDWDRGERSGDGTYEIKDQLKYDGHWADNRKNGKGRQEIQDDLVNEFGYKIYDGDWENDMRTGYGRMEMPADKDGSGYGMYIYEGQFEKNNRHGFGFMKFEFQEEKYILYNGLWRDDKVYSPKDKPSWSHMVTSEASRRTTQNEAERLKRYYYGTLNRDGEREGHGVLYSESAMEDPEFKAAFEEEGANKKYNPSGDQFAIEYPSGKENKFKMYEGQWSRNMPHGRGIQYFPLLKGRYEGQFVEGKRHGRGTWESRDKEDPKQIWKYRPVPEKDGSAPVNWDLDKMHGIAIVEDSKHVHENVIYTQGKCQMPFTNEGPPTTGFDDTKVVGAVVKGFRKMKAYGDGAGRSAADSGFAKETLLSQGVKQQKQQVADDRLDAEELAEAGVLVRQPTDLNTPEEDVLIMGGTGGNEVMNGLYFRMTGTFGLPIYKLIKKDANLFKRLGSYGGVGSGVTERYLYQNTDRSMWIIGPRFGEPLSTTSKFCAAIASTALSPAQISGTWFVWHDDTGRIRAPDDDQDPLEESTTWRTIKPIDKLSCQSIVGFEITGATPDFAHGFSSNLLLRNPREFYSRPVYEAENGGKYLYWLPGEYSINSNDDGDTPEKLEKRVADGLEALEIDAPAEVGEAVDIFKSGAWVLAEEVGVLPGGRRCIGWVRDNGATPDQINERNKWIVKDFTSKDLKFKVNGALRLKLEEWSRMPGSSSLGILDGVDEVDALDDDKTPLLAIQNGSSR